MQRKIDIFFVKLLWTNMIGFYANYLIPTHNAL